LPEYIADSLREFCRKAHIAPTKVCLIVKRRNRCIGDCWVKKGDSNIPSGGYHMDYRTITLRIGKRSSQEDVRYVLAHEIGHLKDHIRGCLLIKPTEDYARRFALLTCNCYPKSNYRGIRKVR